MIASLLRAGTVALVSMMMVMPAHAKGVPAAQAQEARAFVDRVGGEALATLQDKSLNKEQQIAKLNTLFSDAVDIPYVARFVLGRYWRTATPEQQQRYMASYEPFLIHNYVSRVARYSGQTYRLTDARPTDDGAIVGMILQTPGGSEPDVLVNYRLSKTADGYKVIDILVEGVSLLNTQRSEFASVVANRGLDGLIAALEKRAKRG